jgi:uncharacterized protein (TIGR02147 family)
MKKLSVYQFDDFKQFLLAYYHSRKDSRQSFSYRKFAKLVENDSPNFVKLVVDGHRRLSVENIHRFANGIGLQGEDYDYFVLMVHLNQESHAPTAEYYRKKMLAISSQPHISESVTQTFSPNTEQFWKNEQLWDFLLLVNGRSIKEIVQLWTGLNNYTPEKILELLKMGEKKGYFKVDLGHLKIDQEIAPHLHEKARTSKSLEF